MTRQNRNLSDIPELEQISDDDIQIRQRIQRRRNRQRRRNNYINRDYDEAQDTIIIGPSINNISRLDISNIQMVPGAIVFSRGAAQMGTVDEIRNDKDIPYIK